MSTGFEARWSRFRVALLLLAALGFVAIPVGFIANGSEPTLKLLIAAILGIPFFSLAAAILARRLFQTETAVEVNERGIVYRQWSDATVLWKDMRGIAPYAIGRQKMLGIILRNPAKYPGRGVLARLAKINKRFSGYDITVSMTGTDRSFDELLDAIDAFQAIEKRPDGRA